MKKIILLIPLFILSSCNKNSKEEEETIKEHDYSEVASLKSNWEDLFVKEDNTYYFYYYSEHCKHCFEIKNEVIHIALKNKKKIYFCNDKNIVIRDYDISLTIGESNIDNVYINGYPSLIKINNKKIENHLLGSSKIINELRN